MYKNYLLATIRSINKHYTLSIISIGRLAIGRAAVILIGVYIIKELRYDRFHLDHREIFRGGFQYYKENKFLGESEQFTPPLSTVAIHLFPELKSFCRITSKEDAYLTYEDKNLKTREKNTYRV